MNDNIFAETADEFESRFAKEEIELLFLTVESVNGAVVVDEGVLKPCIEFVASVNLTTGTRNMSVPTILTPVTARKPRRSAETSEKLK